MKAKKRMAEIMMVPASEKNKLLSMGYLILRALPVLGGILAIYLGYRLFILGVTGHASLAININSISGQLINAAPGLFFAVGGFIVLIASTYKGVRISIKPDGGYQIYGSGIPGEDKSAEKKSRSSCDQDKP